jgi:hypothetical protein
VEHNLEEAIRYSQNCLQIRQQYSETAKLRNDTRFKGEEFIRLDEVHLQEVDAGLYRLPWQEAADERTALEFAVSFARTQQAITEESSAVLSNDRVSEYIRDTAKLATDSINIAGRQDLIKDGTTKTTQYRTGLEYAAWLQTSAAVKGSAAQLRGKLSTAQRKEAYLRKDEGFRAHRAAISRQLALLQIREHCRPDSVLNYNERLTQQKSLFDANLQCLIERVIALKPGLKDSYDIEVTLEAPRTGSILDTLSVWLVKVQSELSKYKRTQRLAVYSIWSGALTVVPGNAGNTADTFQADLVVDVNAVPATKSLLRGVAFEYIGQQQRPISLKVLPPQGTYIAVDRGGQPDTLQFGRVYHAAPGLELKPQHSDVFWNGSPLGTWKVEGRFNQTAGVINGLVMHLWLASL